MSTYDQAKKDFKTLQKYSDGGDYVEIEASMWDLMANPSKRLAKQRYEAAITCWFDSAKNGGHGNRHEYVDSSNLEIPEVIDIGERYGEL